MNEVISIVIVNYNSKSVLEDFIVSINKERDCTYTREIIVIDNKSSDDSAIHIRNRFPEITVIEEDTNIGFGRANNHGAKIAHGTYLIFANPDAQVVSGKIAEAIDFMKQDPEIGFVGPKIIWPDGRIQVSAAEFLGLGWAVGHHLHIKNLLSQEFLRKALVPMRRFLGKALRSYLFVYQRIKEPTKVDWLTGAFLVVRKSVFQELGGFDEDYFLYFEDQDLCLRGKKKGYPAYYFPDIVIEHQVGLSMKKNPRALIEKYRSELLFWIKHYSPLSLFILRILMGIDFSLRWILSSSKENKEIYSEILRYVFAPKDYILRTQVKL